MHSSAEILAVNISEYFSIRVLKYWLIYTMTCNYIDLHTCTLYSCPRVPYKVQDFRSTPYLSKSVAYAHMQANSACVS